MEMTLGAIVYCMFIYLVEMLAHAKKEYMRDLSYLGLSGISYFFG